MHPLKGPTPARRGGGLAQQSENTRLSLPPSLCAPRREREKREQRGEGGVRRGGRFTIRDGSAGHSVTSSLSNSRLMQKKNGKETERDAARERRSVIKNTAAGEAAVAAEHLAAAAVCNHHVLQRLHSAVAGLIASLFSSPAVFSSGSDLLFTPLAYRVETQKEKINSLLSPRTDGPSFAYSSRLERSLFAKRGFLIYLPTPTPEIAGEQGGKFPRVQPPHSGPEMSGQSNKTSQASHSVQWPREGPED